MSEHNKYSSDSPYGERAKELYGKLPPHKAVTPTLIQPSKYPDGQDRNGTRPEQEHRGGQVAYDHPHAQRYREELRARPRIPSHPAAPQADAGPLGNYEQHAKRGKR